MALWTGNTSPSQMSCRSLYFGSTKRRLRPAGFDALVLAAILESGSSQWLQKQVICGKERIFIFLEGSF